MDYGLVEGEVLHVHVGDRCHNRCLFCNEDAAVRRERVQGTTRSDVEALFDRFPHASEVLFTCGEPTLHPNLPDFVGLARARGYRRVALITNGRRLGEPGYLADLLARGLNDLSVSVHGHRAAVHDALTRRPGAFAQVRAGLQEIHRLRGAGRRFHLSVNSVITRTNLPHLVEMHAFFARVRPDEVVFNAVSPRSRGERHFDELMNRYAEILVALEPLNRPFLRPALRVMEIPACVLVHHGFLHAGAREQWLVFERGVAAIETTAALRPLFRKRPSCARCLLDPVCEGIYRRYAERFGTEEFRPVTQESELWPRPLRDLLHPFGPGDEVADGWALADFSLRQMTDALLLTFRQREGRTMRLAIRRTDAGLDFLPLADRHGDLSLSDFRRDFETLLARLRGVLRANRDVLVGRDAPATVRPGTRPDRGDKRE